MESGVEAVKSLASAKFDETVEVALRLGVDPRHADQMVRGAVVLPHGTGKTVRVAVFAKDIKADEARNAGADVVGDEDLVEQIKNGNVNSTYKEGGYIIGPYSYQIEAGELIECNISVIDDEGKPIEAKLVKRNGMEQLGVNPGEDFYIKTNEDEKNINIKIEVDVKRMTPTIYEAENGDDYIINTYIPDHIEDTLEIEWVD